MSSEKIHNSMLTQHLPTSSWKQHGATNIVLVALNCILNKIQVNCVSLVMHNMETCTKNYGVRHFPRMLSQVVGIGYLNKFLSANAQVACLQPFPTCSFKKLEVVEIIFHDLR